MNANQDNIERLASRLGSARRVVVLTGAGVSAESGLATFRDPQDGLWAQYRPEDLATPEAFSRAPETVWRWYEWRRSKLRQAKPNPGHFALAELQKLMREFTLITQNVDGLHQLAGSRDVIEFHGNITRSVCSNKACGSTWPHGDLPDDPREPPHCDRCGELLRPDVVWFGEAIPALAMQGAASAVEDCDVFISVGTSSLVYPAAGMAQAAARVGATVIEINPNATPLSSDADIVITGPSGVILPAVLTTVGNATR